MEPLPSEHLHPAACQGMKMASYSGRPGLKHIDAVNSSPSFQPATVPPGREVHRLFEARAACTPDAPAVTLADETLTYGALNRTANQLARHLRACGIGPDALVGICLERSPEALVAIMAVLKAGGAYVPLDPAYPEERLTYMLENSGARVLITQAAMVREWPAGLRTVHLGGSGGLHLDAYDDRDLDAAASNDAADPLAYVIYTSGSTGRPKGVAMGHGPLMNLLRWQARICPLEPGSRVLQFAPLSFDVSFQEIFSTLGEGGTLALISEGLRRDPRGLLRLIAREGITRVFVPPVMLYQLAEQHAAGEPAPRALRQVITAGEALRITPAVAGFFAVLQAAGGGALHNHYGPTETHVATAYTLPGPAQDWPPLPSVGQPIDGVKIRLLDDGGEAVEPGQPGALYLGGVCLAREYLHDPALTAAKFVAIDGTRWYCTGDLVQRQPDGNLQFLGRADDQVKIRGFRVELGEVETVLSRHPAIRETAVGVSPGETGGGQELVGYLVPRAGQPVPTPADLRRWLLGQLPDYLVPTHFAVLEQLPLTPSGKVDRRALPRHRATRAAGARAAATPPRTALEKTVALAWEQTLGFEGSDTRDNFFEAGGNSVLAVRLHTRLCQALGREFPIAAIFQHPTIAGLTAYLGTLDQAPVAAPSIQDRARRQQQQVVAAAARARLAGRPG